LAELVPPSNSPNPEFWNYLSWMRQVVGLLFKDWAIPVLQFSLNGDHSWSCAICCARG
jgi:hypothetical protein